MIINIKNSKNSTMACHIRELCELFLVKKKSTSCYLKLDNRITKNI